MAQTNRAFSRGPWLMFSMQQVSPIAINGLAAVQHKITAHNRPGSHLLTLVAQPR